MGKNILIFIFVVTAFAVFCPQSAQAAYHFSNYKGKPPIHIFSAANKPSGITPDQIKKAYHLPPSGGNGTIAIIGAYDASTIENDLKIFSTTFNLPACTSGNGCFEKHQMTKKIKVDSGWATETSLDVEWAHAIAPDAKILLVEATTPSGSNLLKAVDYAAARSDVVAISMSWGGAEFPEETTLDGHFVSKSKAVFFASSGDNGTGASWPASSSNVVAVGGTRVEFTAQNEFAKETAWTGSGGGVSAYEPQPDFQKNYNIPKASGMRAIPDVSYNADPQSGFPIYKSTTRGKGAWYQVGGTSAGSPQWAGIAALGHASAKNENFYNDKASANAGTYFRDIVSGKNGSCSYYCAARKRYDYVTGLGSPLRVNF
jgi:subtilase family serine protease